CFSRGMNIGPNHLELELRRATEAVAKGSGSNAALEGAARALVKHLKAENAQPEQMLLRVKEILADAGLRPAYASTDASTPPNGESAIYRAVIEWSIRYYFDERDA